MKSDIYVIVYFDDTGVAANNKSLVDALIVSLVNMGFQVTRESTFAEFLGIQYDSLAAAERKNPAWFNQEDQTATGLTNC